MLYKKRTLQDRLRYVSTQISDEWKMPGNTPQLLMNAADRMDTLEAQVIELRNAVLVLEAIRRETGT
jgi:hypothetical protein